MKKDLPFDTHVSDYEQWFREYPYIFRSEVEALREMLPEGEKLNGIEIGLGTGRFSTALGIKQGIEPAPNMRKLAQTRGIDVMDASAENLPYGDLRFDFVLMAFCISYFNDLHVAFKEAHRVLHHHAVLVIGFLDKNSIIGQQYEARRASSTFYRSAIFYTVDKVLFELNRAGFKHFKFCQTLFHPLEDIKSIEPAKPGYGEGSFVVIQAQKA